MNKNKTRNILKIGLVIALELIIILGSSSAIAESTAKGYIKIMDVYPVYGGIEVKLKNTGSINITNATYEIEITGRILGTRYLDYKLINQSLGVNKTVTISSKESRYISGLGLLKIKISTMANNSDSEGFICKGMLIGYSIYLTS